MAEHVLSCRGVTVRFGGVTALDGAELDVSEGKIVSVIGPNGAGKTTFFNAVSGFVPASGSVRLDGREITALPPHERGRAGIVRTFQNLEIFGHMSVVENVMTGAYSRVRYSVLHGLLKTPRFLRAERESRDKAMECLDFCGIADQADLPAAELSYGGQRAVELARALAGEPRVLLLDEPAAGLNMRETKDLGKLVRRIRDERGVSIALVEHDMELVMEISDHITVLTFGRVLAAGTPAEIQKHPEVLRAYLGEGGDA